MPVITPLNFSTAAVLSAWASRQVDQLLRELQTLLPQIGDGASLRAVLEQALFFASRMGQVGCDFSGLLLPLFHEVMLRQLATELARALKNFKVMLLSERISFAEANSVSPEPVSGGNTSGGNSSGGSADSNSSSSSSTFDHHKEQVSTVALLRLPSLHLAMILHCAHTYFPFCSVSSL